MDMYQKIQKLLDCKSMNKKDLSNITGIPYSSIISAFNRRSSSFSTAHIQKIAAALNVSVAEIMDWSQFDEQYPHVGDEVRLIEDIEKSYGSGAAELLESFVQLNAKGKEKALDYISDLYEQPKYKK